MLFIRLIRLINSIFKEINHGIVIRGKQENFTKNL